MKWKVTKTCDGYKFINEKVQFHTDCGGLVVFRPTSLDMKSLGGFDAIGGWYRATKELFERMVLIRDIGDSADIELRQQNKVTKYCIMVQIGTEKPVYYYGYDPMMQEYRWSKIFTAFADKDDMEEVLKVMNNPLAKIVPITVG